MSKPTNSESGKAITDAMRAKHERRPGEAAAIADDIAALEASLLAEIEAFNFDALERQPKRDILPGAALLKPGSRPVLPKMATAPVPVTLAVKAELPPPVPPVDSGGGLLSQLRQQAEARQRELHVENAERTSLNEAIDQSLKRVFSYLHEFVEQLNIVKPGIPRNYPLIEQYLIDRLTWQEGFADYRSQSQSAGALIELVSVSYQLAAPDNLLIERDATAVDRFRNLLFDYGLQFDCKEFKNHRRFVERAEFQINARISVSVRWRADFASGRIVVESRNLERLGSSQLALQPGAVDQALLDEFGRLVLGQPNRFRDLAKR